MFSKFIEKVKKQMSKVSVQVSLFSCALIAVSCVLIFAISRTAFMKVIEESYRAKTDIIFNMIEPHMDADDYVNFTDEWSIQTESYNATSNYLNMVKENYNVDNIFITRLNEQRKPVYVMDVGKVYEEIHAPNTVVTGSVAQEVIRKYAARSSLKGSFYVVDGDWEYIKTYMISGSNPDSEAVVCIGINARALIYHTLFIMVLVALLTLGCLVLTIIFANKTFKKISNPFYQDVSNTDSLTGVKNKNSFSVDFHNIENQRHQERYSILMVDLNGLKTINDTRGHHIGDKYIQDSAAILKASIFSRSQYVYRVGGDEFAIIMQDASYSDIDTLVTNIEKNTEKANEKGGSIKISMSVGYAMFEKSVDRNFSDTMQRADTMMYNVKREYYRKKLTPDVDEK